MKVYTLHIFISTYIIVEIRTWYKKHGRGKCLITCKIFLNRESKDNVPYPTEEMVRSNVYGFQFAADLGVE